MGADRTLVDAAFTEAKTRHGGDVIDQSNLYQSTKDISKGYLDLTANVMAGYKAKKLVERTALEAQLAKLSPKNIKGIAKATTKTKAIKAKIKKGALNELKSK